MYFVRAAAAFFLKTTFALLGVCAFGRVVMVVKNLSFDPDDDDDDDDV